MFLILYILEGTTIYEVFTHAGRLLILLIIMGGIGRKQFKETIELEDANDSQEERTDVNADTQRGRGKNNDLDAS